MKAFERCGTLADVRFLLPGASATRSYPWILERERGE